MWKNRIFFYPRRPPMVPANTVMVEILEEDGRHRLYRGFTVSMDKHGNYKSLDKPFNFIASWCERHPGHKAKLFFHGLAPLYRRYMEEIKKMEVEKDGRPS